MHSALAALMATVDKHHVAGIVGIVVGGLILVVGGIRFITKASEAFLIPLAGIVIVVLGLLTYFRTI
jgi:hypothetical protein